jgi:hypothetical protein
MSEVGRTGQLACQVHNVDFTNAAAAYKFTTFSLKVDTVDKQVPISSYTVRHAGRKAFESAELSAEQLPHALKMSEAASGTSLELARLVSVGH